MAGYGSDDGFQAWATAAGHTLPAGTVAAARQRGSQFVDGAYGSRFPGTPAGGVDQEREWPRSGAADRYGNEIASDSIPLRVVHASYEAALLELRTPGTLSRVVIGAERVVREKVEGAVEVEYARPSGTTDMVADATPVVIAIDGLLAPLLGWNAAPNVLVV